MMDVFFITKEPFPNGMAATNRIRCLAKACIAGGMNCKVIIFGRQNDDNETSPIGTFEGVPYEYIGGSVKRWKSFLGRLQSLFLQINLLLYLFAKLKKNDIIYGYIQRNNYLKKIIIFIVHKRKAFFVSELCELPFESGRDNKSANANRSYVYNHLFPYYDGVVAISDTLKQVALKYCNPSCVVIKIPILVEFDKYDLSDRTLEINEPYIFHSGTLSEQKDGILGMLEAFGKAHARLNKNIHFILTGKMESSIHYKEIVCLIKKYDIIDSVHFVGYLSNTELKEKLSKASMVIINKYPTRQNQYCFSTKLGEYMAAGKPIIITRVGEAMNWLSNGKDCIVIEPNDNNQLADEIVKGFNDYNNMKAIGENAKKRCLEAFDYHQYGKAMLNMFNKIVQ